MSVRVLTLKPPRLIFILGVQQASAAHNCFSIASKDRARGEELFASQGKVSTVRRPYALALYLLALVIFCENEKWHVDLRRVHCCLTE